jgi:hypothetical protein
MGVGHQDRLADWPSVVTISTWILHAHYYMTFRDAVFSNDVAYCLISYYSFRLVLFLSIHLYGAYESAKFNFVL